MCGFGSVGGPNTHPKPRLFYIVIRIIILLASKCLVLVCIECTRKRCWVIFKAGCTKLRNSFNVVPSILKLKEIRSLTEYFKPMMLPSVHEIFVDFSST